MSKVKAIAARSFRYRGGKGGEAKLYKAGDPWSGSKEERDDLVNQGALVPESTDDDGEEGSSGGKDIPRDDLIKASICALIEEDPEKLIDTYWKKDGSPRAPAVKASLEIDASAEEIDAVWAKLIASGDDEGDDDGQGEGDGGNENEPA